MKWLSGWSLTSYQSEHKGDTDDLFVAVRAPAEPATTALNGMLEEAKRGTTIVSQPPLRKGLVNPSADVKTPRCSRYFRNSLIASAGSFVMESGTFQHVVKARPIDSLSECFFYHTINCRLWEVRGHWYLRGRFDIGRWLDSS